MAVDVDENPSPYGPFEGPEKLLEIWFAPSPADVPDASSATDGRCGLRKVPQHVWEEMLDIVKCKILSVVRGDEIDAYLLSESSLFVAPHRLILKTCGTTLNLSGLPRILEIASGHASLPSVYRCFYSRKAFMFPDRQHGPHRDWKAEVEFLDNIFPDGAAYTIGKVNGDHWLLYITSPGEDLNTGTAPNSPHSVPKELVGTEDEDSPASLNPDYTIEILMTNLSAKARQYFHADQNDIKVKGDNSAEHALALSSAVGIADLFPAQLTTLDAYSFTPCGYSSNALIRQPQSSEPAPENAEGYYTIHVTPEEGWSYASFECNVPLPTKPTPQLVGIPDLKTLIRRVVNIFEPGRLTLTLFVSSEDNTNAEEEGGESAIEAAQRAFKAALTLPGGRCAKPSKDDATQSRFTGLYKRTDKINYEFGGYDLAFATFELRS